MSVQLARYSFTVEEYRRMGEANVFLQDARVELIEGEIVKMSPIGKRHASCVARLTRALTLLLQHVALVWTQNPVELDEYSEPQPDVCVLKWRDDFYNSGHPQPEDVLLVIEVSDSTLEYDRQIKVPLYARAGIPEVWIVNINDERVETFADVSGGAYRMTGSVSRGEEVQSRSLAELRLGVSEIFG
jgi:Uma2 family endonuclease